MLVLINFSKELVSVQRATIELWMHAEVAKHGGGVKSRTRR